MNRTCHRTREICHIFSSSAGLVFLSAPPTCADVSKPRRICVVQVTVRHLRGRYVQTQLFRLLSPPEAATFTSARLYIRPPSMQRQTITQVLNAEAKSPKRKRKKWLLLVRVPVWGQYLPQMKENKIKTRNGPENSTLGHTCHHQHHHQIFPCRSTRAPLLTQSKRAAGRKIQTTRKSTFLIYNYDDDDRRNISPPPFQNVRPTFQWPAQQVNGVLESYKASHLFTKRATLSSWKPETLPVPQPQTRVHRATILLHLPADESHIGDKHRHR